MYVCLCNGLTDRELRAQSGAGRSVSMVYQACGCQPKCGKCVPLVREMVRDSTEAPTVGLLDGAD